MRDTEGAAKYVQTIEPGTTVLIVWQHWFIPFIMRALESMGELAPQLWPETCPYHEWVEPDYTIPAEKQQAKDSAPPSAPVRMDDKRECYDVLWQVVLYRDNPGHHWRAASFSQMHMGFGGSADSPCVASFYANSTKFEGTSAEEPTPHCTGWWCWSRATRLPVASDPEQELLGMPSSAIKSGGASSADGSIARITIGAFVMLLLGAAAGSCLTTSDCKMARGLSRERKVEVEAGGFSGDYTPAEVVLVGTRY